LVTRPHTESAAPATNAAPVVGVLALQGDVREHLAALTAAGARAVPVRRPRELAAVEGIVLPGGESTTIGKLLATFDLLAPLRAAVAAGLPAYGSCAGMILLATTVLDGRPDQQLIGGMDVVVRRNAFGRQVDSFEGPVEVTGLGTDPAPMHAVFIRAPVVESTGPGVEVLGRVRSAAMRLLNGPAAAEGARPSVDRIVAVRQANLLATAFHPELTGDLRVHRLFVGMVRDSRRSAPGDEEQQ
jgi:5'-phosphate synthase pdxT subunit